MQVNIYIEMSSHAPKIRQGYFGFVLECKIKGEKKTKEYFGMEGDTTANRLALCACVWAISRMRKPSEITIHINSGYVKMGHRYLEEWRAAGWKNSRGKPVVNKDLWKELQKREKPHKVSVSVDAENEYSKWILTQIGKIKRGEEDGRQRILGKDDVSEEEKGKKA